MEREERKISLCAVSTESKEMKSFNDIGSVPKLFLGDMTDSSSVLFERMRQDSLNESIALIDIYFE